MPQKKLNDSLGITVTLSKRNDLQKGSQLWSIVYFPVHYFMKRSLLGKKKVIKPHWSGFYTTIKAEIHVLIAILSKIPANHKKGFEKRRILLLESLLNPLLP